MEPPIPLRGPLASRPSRRSPCSAGPTLALLVGRIPCVNSQMKAASRSSGVAIRDRARSELAAQEHSVWRNQCRGGAAVLWLALSAFAAQTHAAQADGTQQVLEHHGNAARSGSYVVPGLTLEAAAHLHADPDFHADIAGP